MAREPGCCGECGEKLELTGRNTPYCPSCDVCPECGCPDADGFQHYAGCKAADDDLCPACEEPMFGCSVPYVNSEGETEQICPSCKTLCDEADSAMKAEAGASE